MSVLTAQDVELLRRTLRLAMNGRGHVEPNPMVGCLIAKDGRVIAEGFHARYGGPHAEPTALATLTESPVGATAYVTLEPCCHTNKQTPPCAPRLIEAGIKRVVIGCLDPNPDVNGKGVAMLQAAGIDVVPADDAIAAEFRQLIAPFTLGQSMKRPYVTIKWAQTADGFITGAHGNPIRITGQESDAMVHRLRGRSHAIGVGAATVFADSPRLNARGPDTIRQPIRLIFDRHLKVSPTEPIFTDGGAPITVLTTAGTLAAHPDRVAALRETGAAVESFDERTRSSAVFARLQSKHLMIESGGRLAASFLPWADRLWVFRSPSKLDSRHGAIAATKIPAYYKMAGQRQCGGDTLTEYFNTRSDSFVTATPSADFLTS